MDLLRTCRTAVPVDLAGAIQRYIRAARVSSVPDQLRFVLYETGIEKASVKVRSLRRHAVWEELKNRATCIKLMASGRGYGHAEELAS
jgi:hypothetical protein